MRQRLARSESLAARGKREAQLPPLIFPGPRLKRLLDGFHILQAAAALLAEIFHAMVVAVAVEQRSATEPLRRRSVLSPAGGRRPIADAANRRYNPRA